VVEPTLELVAEGCKEIEKGTVHRNLPVPGLGKRMGAETFSAGHEKIPL
jgi:hypothetical protein